MKNINDYIHVEQNDDKKCSINCHKITIDSKNRQDLGEHKFSEIKNYFKTLKTKFEDESSNVQNYDKIYLNKDYGLHSQRKF